MPGPMFRLMFTPEGSRTNVGAATYRPACRCHCRNIESPTWLATRSRAAWVVRSTEWKWLCTTMTLPVGEAAPPPPRLGLEDPPPPRRLSGFGMLGQSMLICSGAVKIETILCHTCWACVLTHDHAAPMACSIFAFAAPIAFVARVRIECQTLTAFVDTHSHAAPRARLMMSSII